MGAEHFIERGYRSFGFCGYSDLDWSVQRRRGFAEGVGLAGFPCALLEQPIFPDHNAPDWEQNLMLNIAAWIEGKARPVGIMACHDICAIQVMRACQHLGLVVPDQAAVLGVDDDAIRCELSYPSLSSVATNRFVQGYAAARLLDKLISGTRVKPATVGIGPSRVEVRRSSDILAIRDNTMASALEYVRDKACTGITVANVARHVAVSRSQLEKKFRQHIGRSPKCEIFKVQMAKAKQLLVDTDLPLKRIAGLVGFKHPEYLSVVFKRHTKVPPGTYRRNAQARA
jgi:LacI family transcriptional regulator